MDSERERPFYVMIFLTLLAAGGVFVVASAVTMDRVRYFSVPRRYAAALHKAMSASFSNFGAPTGAGGAAAARLKAFAAGLGVKLAGGQAPGGATPPPAGGGGDGSGGGAPRGPKEQLFNFTNGLADLAPRLLGRGGRRAYENDDGPGDIPRSETPRAQPRRGAAPGARQAAPPPQAAPGHPEETPGPGQPAERPEAHRGAPAPRAGGAGPAAGSASSVRDWTAGAQDRGASPEVQKPDFDLDGLKAAALKKAAAGTADPSVKAEAAPGGGSGGGSTPTTAAGAALKDLAAKVSGKPPPETSSAGAAPAPKPAAKQPAAAVLTPPPQQAPAAQAGAPAELTDQDRQEIEEVIRWTVGSLESGYGPMASLRYTDCAESPLCAENGLEGGFFTMTTEPGAVAKFGVRKEEGKWVHCTIFFEPPPQPAQ